METHHWAHGSGCFCPGLLLFVILLLRIFKMLEIFVRKGFFLLVTGGDSLLARLLHAQWPSQVWLWLYGLQPSSLLCPGNYGGQNTWAGYYRPDRGMEPMSPALTGRFFTTETPGKPRFPERVFFVLFCFVFLRACGYIELSDIEFCSSSQHLLSIQFRIWAWSLWLHTPTIRLIIIIIYLPFKITTFMHVDKVKLLNITFILLFNKYLLCIL